MGEKDSDAVVDERLRVHGCQGLQIIDSSVFRDSIGGSINAAFMAVVGKGAALALEDVAGG